MIQTSIGDGLSPEQMANKTAQDFLRRSFRPKTGDPILKVESIGYGTTCNKAGSGDIPVDILRTHGGVITARTRDMMIIIDRGSKFSYRLHS